MAIWTGNLRDVGLGFLTGLNPVIEFHLNSPQVSNTMVWATRPVSVTPSSGGAFTVDLADTRVMYGDAYYTMHVRWLEPGSPSSSGYAPVDVHIDFPIRTNSAGGPIGDAVGGVSNMAFVLVGLTQPAALRLGQLWWKTDPDNPYGPANTGLIYVGGN